MLLLAVPPPVFADELSAELPKSTRDILDEGGTDLSDTARWRFSDLCDTVGAWAAEGLQPALHLAAQSAGYLLLAGLVALYVTRQEKLLTGASPWEVFSRLTALRLPPEGFGVGIALLVLILLGMAVQPRFFCQFLCPMGAVFALLPVLPFARLHRQSESCIPGCNACKQQCPVCLKLEESSLRSGECIACEACVGTCPKQNIHRWDTALCKHQWLPVLGKALLFFLLGCWLGFCRFI